MAPNKKKKKPAANPARGFATTSVASKQKPLEEPEADAEVSKDGAKSKQKSELRESKEEQPKDIAISNNSKSLQELSPDELEAHLEESDLQAFIEKHGDKSKREAARQISRIKTEKRLLRSQVDTLSTFYWLPSEIIQQVYDYANKSTNYVSQDESAQSTSKNSLPSDEDMQMHLWRLEIVLPALGFSNEQCTGAIQSLLKQQRTFGISSNRGVKDGLWGLDECLNSLASTLVEADGTDYETLGNESRTIDDDISSDTDTPDSHSVSVPITPAESTPMSEAASEPSEGDLDSDDQLSDLDSDVEPEKIIERYLKLRTQLYHLAPTDLASGVRTEKGRPRKAQTLPQSTRRGRKVAHVQSQISRITSDILFDNTRADMLWQSEEIVLRRESAERRSLNQQSSPRKQDIRTSEAVEQDKSGSEDELMVGDLFGALPEMPDQKIGAIDGTTSAADVRAPIVQIVDFGKWTGIGPRRVFEEACKARDSSCKVMVQLISKTAFSYRHSVRIRWSKPQESYTPPPYSSVVIKSRSSLRLRLDMFTIACSETSQSEAYVCTVALFLVFFGSPKEEKAHLRLPSVWRDLWGDMVQRNKASTDALDREVIKNIRSLIEKTPGELNEFTESDSQPTRGKSDGESRVQIATTKEESPPDMLKALWAQKQSSSNYQKMLTSRMTLPIWQYRGSILGAIEDHQVVIICGATGCGKSTQVPTFILENELSQGRPCKIYCTEPRRISAISLARRVSEELGERKTDVGTTRSLVGFAIRLESQVTAQTRLVYATTGIVMRMLEGSQTLDGITHLLLDEVHERSIDSDFLLIILRKLLVRRPSLKVVLMSATVDAQKFSNYLGQAPIFEVPGRTFPVEARFLEDAVELTNFRLSEAGGEAVEMDDVDQDEDAMTENDAKRLGDLNSYSPRTRETMKKINEYRVPYELIVQLMQQIHSGSYKEYGKATLIFLPGIAEIRRLNDMLLSHRAFSKQCEVFALHSTIATEDQERAFLVPQPGVRKIVLATNIAETGITIPDITCVIDTGKHKEMRFEERRQLSRLVEVFIAQANAMQRRGRAGRVQKGLCFHLYSQSRFDRMPKEQVPEMLRLSLQDLVLRVKICKLGGIEETLSEAVDPPSAKNVRRAIDALQDVKALTSHQELTILGRQLARLPLDVFLGKLLLLGSIFGCLDVALSIAAILSSKSPFLTTIASRNQADQARLFFKKGNSDLLTIYNAYAAWRRVCNTTGASEQQFCRQNCLSIPTLLNIEDLKGQLMTSLADAGFVILNAEEQSALHRRARSHHSYSSRRTFVPIPEKYSVNSDNDLTTTSVIAMAFYPKILKREGKGWRSIANNQIISLHPSSVNKRRLESKEQLKYLSFYHIMQSASSGGGKSYNAHETSAVEEIAIALLCGDAEVKMYAGVIVIDGNRLRFSVKDWRTMFALKILRAGLRRIVDAGLRDPGKAVAEQDAELFNICLKMFEKGKKIEGKTELRSAKHRFG